jgi:hypothetical protein
MNIFITFLWAIKLAYFGATCLWIIVYLDFLFQIYLISLRIWAVGTTDQLY